MKNFKAYSLFLFSLFSSLQAPVAAQWGGNCLNYKQASDVISRFTSIAIQVNVQTVDETVTDNFQFFSDNQDFLEGLPVSYRSSSSPLFFF